MIPGNTSDGAGDERQWQYGDAGEHGPKDEHATDAGPVRRGRGLHKGCVGDIKVK